MTKGARRRPHPFTAQTQVLQGPQSAPINCWPEPNSCSTPGQAMSARHAGEDLRDRRPVEQAIRVHQVAVRLRKQLLASQLRLPLVVSFHLIGVGTESSRESAVGIGLPTSASRALTAK